MNLKRLGLPILIFASLTFVFLLKANSAQAATLSLEPATADIKAGEDLVVQVMLETKSDEMIDGADAVLKFDPLKLKPKEVKSGEAFKNIVTKESRGQIQITGLASPEGARFTSTVDLASVSFQILEGGKTAIDFDFSANLTTDSNVAAHGTAKDLLTAVSGGEYQVTATPAQQTFSFLRRLLPFLPIVIVILLIGGALYYWYKNRSSGGPREEVFVPHEVPLDRPPEPEKSPPLPPPPDLGVPVTPSAGEGS